MKGLACLFQFSVSIVQKMCSTRIMNNFQVSEFSKRHCTSVNCELQVKNQPQQNVQDRIIMTTERGVQEMQSVYTGCQVEKDVNSLSKHVVISHEQLSTVFHDVQINIPEQHTSRYIVKSMVFTNSGYPYCMIDSSLSNYKNSHRYQRLEKTERKGVSLSDI